jgi:hypothetical protein
MIRRIVAIASLALAMGVWASAAMAEPPYEPNDNILTAAGPLGINQTYTAALETENDRDYYYFYVTGPTTAQVSITLTNLGGAVHEAGVIGYIDNSEGSEITNISSALASPGQYGSKSVSLEPGKYFVQIENDDAYGDSYKFTTSGTTGAFGEYSTIAAQCQAAQGPVNQYHAQVATAEASLKTAEAKLKRYGESRNPKVRKKIRAKVAHVKKVVTAEKESLKAAEKAESPWCSIPQ